MSTRYFIFNYTQLLKKPFRLDHRTEFRRKYRRIFYRSGSNRGDYNVRISGGASDDFLDGIYIPSIIENGRDHEQEEGIP